MATDVDVQFFSHLNGLVLGNNWGDLIRLLDKALVTGIDFTQITAASIDEQGDVHISLYSDHKAMLLQVVELSGFAPASLNQKYRIKGVPNATGLILKPHIAINETAIATIGTGRIASLGYEIIFRDSADIKRVYRAKNPTAQHPFIRVDESIASDMGTYTSTYAKFAMVGLLEHMEHLDDYENPEVLQLPFDPSDPVKNWRISGAGTSVVRGWSRWHWARGGTASNQSNVSDVPVPNVADRNFTIVGDADAFWFIRSTVPTPSSADGKLISGCGLYDSSLSKNTIPNWFLSGAINQAAASSNNLTSFDCAMFGAHATAAYAAVACLKYNEVTPLHPHVLANLVIPTPASGRSGDYVASTVAALQIPIYDSDKFLRGNLKHILYSGNVSAVFASTPIIAGNSMYLYETAVVAGGNGGYYFYFGELE